jgi:hypothetical protein
MLLRAPYYAAFVRTVSWKTVSAAWWPLYTDDITPRNRKSDPDFLYVAGPMSRLIYFPISNCFWVVRGQTSGQGRELYAVWSLWWVPQTANEIRQPLARLSILLTVFTYVKPFPVIREILIWPLDGALWVDGDASGPVRPVSAAEIHLRWLCKRVE